MPKQNPIQTIENNKSKLLAIFNVFLPSALGLWVYFVIFVLTVIISQPSQYKQALQGFHIDQLQGTFIYSFIHDFVDVIDTQLANEVAIYIFWAVIAAGVYIGASRLTKNVNELEQDLKLRDYIWPQGNDKNRPLKDFLEKLLFRLVMAGLFIFYIFKLLPVLADIWKRSDLKLALSLHTLISLIILL